MGDYFFENFFILCHAAKVVIFKTSESPETTAEGWIIALFQDDLVRSGTVLFPQFLQAFVNLPDKIMVTCSPHQVCNYQHHRIKNYSDDKYTQFER